MNEVQFDEVAEKAARSSIHSGSRAISRQKIRGEPESVSSRRLISNLGGIELTPLNSLQPAQLPDSGAQERTQPTNERGTAQTGKPLDEPGSPNEDVPAEPPEIELEDNQTKLLWILFLGLILTGPFLLVRLILIFSQIHREIPQEPESFTSLDTNWYKNSIFNITRTPYPVLPHPQEMFEVELVTGTWPANSYGCKVKDSMFPKRPRRCTLPELEAGSTSVPAFPEQTIQKWDTVQFWVVRGKNTSMKPPIQYLNQSDVA